MSELISFSKVLEHERLCDRLNALRGMVGTARADAPDRLASATLTLTAAALLRDLYRLISREPGARTLPRLDPLHPPRHQHLAEMLRDARLALDAFAHAHRDHDDETGDEWLTIEALDFMAERQQKKLSPPAEAGGY